MCMMAYILHGITGAQYIRTIEQLLIRKPALHIVLHFINHKLNSRFLKDPGLPKAALDAAWIFDPPTIPWDRRPRSRAAHHAAPPGPRGPVHMHQHRLALTDPERARHATLRPVP